MLSEVHDKIRVDDKMVLEKIVPIVEKQKFKFNKIDNFVMCSVLL